MIVTLCTLVTAFLAGVGDCSIQASKTSRYGLLPTEATVQARLEWGHITHEQVHTADGLIAVQDCGRIGEWVVLRPKGSPDWHKMLVFDCAQRDDPHTQEFMRHIPYEVDYHTAQSWGYEHLGALEIEVWQIGASPP